MGRSEEVQHLGVAAVVAACLGGTRVLLGVRSKLLGCLSLHQPAVEVTVRRQALQPPWHALLRSRES